MTARSFGQLVRYYRRARDFTQTNLAAGVGYAVSTIRRIENDTLYPSQELFERLVACLEIPVEEYLRFTDHSPTDDKDYLQPMYMPSSFGNVTVPLPMIGRDKDLNTIHTLLHQPDVRLITLTGLGGIGKTCLAVNVAYQIRHLFPDGVFMISMTSIHNEHSLLSTLAKELGLTQHGQIISPEQLQSYLQDKHILFLMDGFEESLSIAPLLQFLLLRSSHVRILVTSRQRINISGEHVVVIKALQTPTLTSLPPAEELINIPAVALFIMRARIVQPDLAITTTNAPTIAAICVQAAGIPLALELIASQLDTYSLHELQHTLEQPSFFLEELVPSQNIRTVLDWSYQILDDDCKTLFVQLGIFANSWTLEAINHICVPDNLALTTTEPTNHSLHWSGLKQLARLCEVNLVQPIKTNEGNTRYTMLDPIRTYVQEKLQRQEILEALYNRHAQYYLSQTEGLVSQHQDIVPHTWLEQVEKDYSNILLVLQWSVSQHKSAVALRLGSVLWHFWFQYGYLREGQHWLEQVRSLQVNDLWYARAGVLLGDGTLALYQNNYAAAHASLMESLHLWYSIGNNDGVATTLEKLGVLATIQQQWDHARHYFQTSFDLFQGIHHHTGMASALLNRGTLANKQGHITAGKHYYKESLAIAQQLEHQSILSKVLTNLGLIAQYEGNYIEANMLFTESLKYFRACSDEYWQMIVLLKLAMTSLYQSQYGQTMYYLQKLLPGMPGLNNKNVLVQYLECWAAFSSLCGNTGYGIQLWAASATLRTVAGIPIDLPIQQFLTHFRDNVLGPIDSLAHTSAWIKGQTLSVETAIDMTLELAETIDGKTEFVV